jgi:flagellar hook assembly protein FlgD
VRLETAGELRLEMLALDGRRVALLFAGRLEAGEHRFHWDGRDAAGRALGSGVYLCRLLAAGREESVKMTLLK